MSTLPHLLFCCVLPTLALPSQEGLSKEGRQAAGALVRSGWSGGVPSSDLGFSVRLAPVCTPAMRNALAHLEDLPEKTRQAFASWARIEFRKPGWFFKTKVEKGKYEIGLGLAHGQPMLTLRKGGSEIGQSPFWFQGEVSAQPKIEIQKRKAASVLTMRFDNIALSYRFVPETAHLLLARRLEVYRKGRVTIRSDLACHRQIRDLAAWMGEAMKGSESFFGIPPGKNRYELWLLATRKGYQDADQLWTGGHFARNWAFTSNQSQISFLWYHPHAQPEAFADHGMPERIKALSLHELQHALSYQSYPSLGDAIPRWFSEALAERGVQAGLAAVDKKLARRMHQEHVDRLAYARADTVPPTYQDLLDWKTGSQMSTFYSAAYLYSYRGVPKRPKELPALLTRIADAGFPHDALFVLRDHGFDAAAYAKALSLGQPKLPLRILGDYDVAPQGLRLISSEESQGRLLLPKTASKDNLHLKGSFSWFPLGARQVDLYLGYRRGLSSAEFLKLALMPGRVVLFSYRAGTWFRVAIQDYDTNLEVGTAQERAWHGFEVDLDSKGRKVDLVIGKDRKASFALPGNFHLVGSRVGLGVYDGIAWFKDIDIR